MLLFNGPTSRNEAGYLYWLFGVNCNLFIWDCCRLLSLDLGRAAPSGGGTTMLPRLAGAQHLQYRSTGLSNGAISYGS